MFISEYAKLIIKTLLIIGYELMPVHPSYAYRQLINLRVIVTDISQILIKELIPSLNLIWNFCQTLTISFWIYLISWIILFTMFHYVEFGSMFLIASLFYWLFQSLNYDSSKDGSTLSAYSVFNRGFTSILGTLTADQLDRQIRHTDKIPGMENDDDDVSEDDDDDGLIGNNRIRDDRQVEDGQNGIRKRGKKKRRTYEARLERRRVNNNNMQQDDDDMYIIINDEE